MLGDDLTWPNNDEDIIRGRKTIEDDLANDTRKDNYIILSNHEEGRKRLKEQMKDRLKLINNGAILPIKDTHELTLTRQFN